MPFDATYREDAPTREEIDQTEGPLLLEFGAYAIQLVAGLQRDRYRDLHRPADEGRALEAAQRKRQSIGQRQHQGGDEELRQRRRRQSVHRLVLSSAA